MHWAHADTRATFYGEIDFVVANRLGRLVAIEQKNGALSIVDGDLVAADGSQGLFTLVQVASSRSEWAADLRVDQYRLTILVDRSSLASMNPPRAISARTTDDRRTKGKLTSAKPGPGSKRAAGATGHMDTKKALVWCGTELLTERGFQMTGIEEVLKRVGVPKGSFYHFFASKREFGEAVIQNYEQFYAKKMDRIFNNKDRAPLDRLRDFVRDATAGMAKYDFRRGCLIGTLGQEMASLDDEFRRQLEAVLLSWEERVTACLEEAILRGDLAPDSDAISLSRFFWNGWEGAILRAKLTRSLEPLNQFASLYFSKFAVDTGQTGLKDANV